MPSDECCTVIVVTDDSPTYVTSFDIVPGGWTPSVSALIELSANDLIPVTHNIMRIAGVSGAVVMTSAPTIDTSGLADGQHVVFHGRSETKYITLQDESNLSGSKLHLEHGRNCILANNDLLELMYVASEDVLIEVRRVDNY
jgi:hypothetical protein